MPVRTRSYVVSKFKYVQRSNEKIKNDNDFNVETTVKEIIWTANSRGNLKPYVTFNPIEFNSCVIHQATGYNARFIRKNNLGPGSLICVAVSNGMIPYIDYILSSTEASYPDIDYHWNENETEIIEDRLVEDPKVIGSKPESLEIQEYVEVEYSPVNTKISTTCGRNGLRCTTAETFLKKLNSTHWSSSCNMEHLEVPVLPPLPAGVKLVGDEHVMDPRCLTKRVYGALQPSRYDDEIYFDDESDQLSVASSEDDQLSVASSEDDQLSVASSEDDQLSVASSEDDQLSVTSSEDKDELVIDQFWESQITTERDSDTQKESSDSWVKIKSEHLLKGQSLEKQCLDTIPIVSPTASNGFSVKNEYTEIIIQIIDVINKFVLNKDSYQEFYSSELRKKVKNFLYTTTATLIDTFLRAVCTDPSTKTFHKRQFDLIYNNKSTEQKIAGSLWKYIKAQRKENLHIGTPIIFLKVISC
ncbi:MAG: hypothetical protein JKX76_01155 [Colwellia sp.]|nr:hypothetical protein [Colwellia sp.]